MYLIFGASGFFGPYIIKEILKKTNEKVIATYNLKKVEIVDERVSWCKIDLTNSSEIQEFLPRLNLPNEEIKVIYLSAISSPDLVEKNPQLGYEINVNALQKVIKNIPNLKTFYFASTDSVYGESVDDYLFSETDILSPINQYAKQKAEAESIVLNFDQNVVRFPLMVGPSISEKKHLYDVIIDSLSNKKPIEMFSDSYRNCLSFSQAAQYLVEIIERYGSKKIGALNLCSDKAISRYELALLIAQKFSYDKNLVVAVESDSLNQIFTSKRAKKTLMSNSKLKHLIGLEKVEIFFD